MEDTRNLIDTYKGLAVDTIKSIQKKKAFEFHVAIENLQHDFNIGSIVRSANAFNASGVHIIGKRHWNRRGAMATEKYVELYHHSNVEDFRIWARHNSYELIGIDNVEGSVALSKATLPLRCVLVFGQEGPGLSDAMKEVVSGLVCIEQFGTTRSINVGAAASIVMYTWIYTHKLTNKQSYDNM